MNFIDRLVAGNAARKKTAGLDWVRVADTAEGPETLARPGEAWVQAWVVVGAAELEEARTETRADMARVEWGTEP